MKHSILIASAAAFMLLPVMAQGQAAPIVVLEYPAYAGASSGGLDSNNVFVADPNHTAHHRVQPNETLSHIITDYYAGSGLDLSVVQMAIVKKNKGAFVRGNPNFLFAGQSYTFAVVERDEESCAWQSLWSAVAIIRFAPRPNLLYWWLGCGILVA
jgi:hypothetical protein